MAIKSANTKGNPYHNESDGRFTSANGASASGDDGKKPSITLRPGFDLASAKSALQQAKTASAQPAPAQQTPQGGPFGMPNPNAYRQASTIDEAVQIGKSILPGCLVNYSEGCNIGKINDLNMALADISGRFPLFLANGLLSAYGDGVSLDADDLYKHTKEAAMNVLKEDKFFSSLYDEFYKNYQLESGISDGMKYSEAAIFLFLGHSWNYASTQEYVSKTIGFSTLAFYQNTFELKKPIVGGKSVSGIIKFYKSKLRDPNDWETSENNKNYDFGFHFRPGDRSASYANGTHELGHALFTIAYKKCSDEERAELDAILKDGRTKDSYQVSGYGHTNNYEQEAEAVSDVMCRGKEATPHNRRVVAWLDKVHARIAKGDAR